MIQSMVRSRVRAALVCAVALAVVPVHARAQNPLEQKCATSSAFSNVQQFCNLVAQAIEIAQPRLGLAFAGGNPVAGTASTMGKSIVALPRFSVVVRGTGVYAKLPAISTNNSEINLVAPTGNVDASFGLFTGFGVAPTIGGLFSIDLLGSAGILPVPSGKGFSGGSSRSYAGGVRLGILRESFTAPGISGSAMYRRIEHITYGDPQFSSRDAYFNTNGFSTVSLRGAVSKRLLFIGATAGVGYDRFKSNVVFSARRGLLSTGTLSVSGYDSNRTIAFGNLSWTMLVLTASLEGGWQSGGTASTVAIPAGTTNQTGKGAPFGSIALRLTL
jgi:hypothetical protein